MMISICILMMSWILWLLIRTERIYCTIPNQKGTFRVVSSNISHYNTHNTIQYIVPYQSSHQDSVLTVFPRFNHNTTKIDTGNPIWTKEDKHLQQTLHCRQSFQLAPLPFSHLTGGSSYRKICDCRRLHFSLSLALATSQLLRHVCHKEAPISVRHVPLYSKATLTASPLN